MRLSKKEMKNVTGGDPTPEPAYPIVVINPIIIHNPINPVGDSNPLPAIPVQIPIILR